MRRTTLLILGALLLTGSTAWGQDEEGNPPTEFETHTGTAMIFAIVLTTLDELTT